MNQRRVLSEWKCSIILLIYKRGSRSKVTNYRPVSLLPTISRVVEREIVQTIMTHMDLTRLFSEVNYQFHRNRSYITNLLESLDPSFRCRKRDAHMLCGYIKSIWFFSMAKGWHEGLLCKGTRRWDQFKQNLCDQRYPTGVRTWAILLLMCINDTHALLRCSLFLLVNDKSI